MATEGDPDAEATPAQRIADADRAVREAASSQPVDDVAEAEALLARGRAYAADRQTAPALADFDRVVERFSADRRTEVQILVGRALRGRAARLREEDPRAAEVAARASVERLEALAEIEAGAADALGQALWLLALVLRDAGRHVEALEALDRIDALIEASAARPELIELNARASTTRSLVLDRAGRGEEAAEVRRALVARHAPASGPQVRAQVEAAEADLAAWTRRQGDVAEAYRELGTVVERYRGRPSGSWSATAEFALAQEGSWLWDDDREPEALAVFDEWLERFAGTAAGDLRRQARELRVRHLRALVVARQGDEAQALEQIDALLALAASDGEGRAEAVVTAATITRVGLEHRVHGRAAGRRALRQVEARLAEHPAPEDAGVQVQLMQDQLVLLRDLRDQRAARRVARDFVERFMDRDDATLERGLAFALQIRSRIAWDLGDPDGETAALETLVARLGASTDRRVLDRVDECRGRLVVTLGAAGRFDALLAQVAELVARFERAETAVEVRSRGERAIRGLGELVKTARLRELEPLARRLLARAEAAGEPGEESAVRALMVVAHCAQAGGRQGEFEVTYDRIFEHGEPAVALFRELSDHFATVLGTRDGRYEHALHLVGLAKALEAAGHDEEALEVLDRVLDEHGDSQEEDVPALMELAREGREELRERPSGIMAP